MRWISPSLPSSRIEGFVRGQTPRRNGYTATVDSERHESRQSTTGEILREYAEHDPAEIDRRLGRAVQGFETWRRTSLAERAARLARGSRGPAPRPRHAGAPHDPGDGQADRRRPSPRSTSARGPASTSPSSGPADLAPESIATDASRSLVRFDPLGVVLAVMPWNFPLWQVFRAAVPALMAGNVVRAQARLERAGLGAGGRARCSRTPGSRPARSPRLLVPAAVAEALIDDRDEIAAVTLTGSEAAGVAVGGAAGAALKKIVLELGGSDPFIVLADADPGARSPHRRSRRA